MDGAISQIQLGQHARKDRLAVGGQLYLVVSLMRSMDATYKNFWPHTLKPIERYCGTSVSCLKRMTRAFSQSRCTVLVDVPR
jgi:hypothetical protein